MTDFNDNKWLTASDLANYVVCPEQWRLKFFKFGGIKETDRLTEGKAKRQEWIDKGSLSKKLGYYARIILILLFILTIVVFIYDHRRNEFISHIITKQNTYISINEIPEEIVALILMLGALIFIWDLFERRKNKLSKEIGITTNINNLSLKEQNSKDSSELISESLYLRSKPDAIIKENNITIPVDIHPMTNKVRDRHVVQLLLHLKIINELTNKTPEYGVLIMGKDKREVKIKNTPEKQTWISSLIDEMRSIIDGVPSIPTPAFYKCKSCDVKDICSYSAYSENLKHKEMEKQDDSETDN
ncbi:MAG: Dna2/Cas4 domain-containing protein [Proteobacteria bacterium]|nr:Dna2/Cas4 domain-containing protein [Pseudomonadota bacterium]